MEQQIQSLIDSIRKEGIDKARSESDKIIEDAKKSAEKIISDAKAEAEKIISEADASAARLQASAEEAIRQSARNASLALKKDIEDKITAILSSDCRKALSLPDLCTIIRAAISEDVSGTAIEVPKEVFDERGDSLRSEFASEIEKGMEEGGSGRELRMLQYITLLKQLCNHPAQAGIIAESGSNYAPERSGKFKRIGELCTEIASRQERVLIFTQFKEIIEPLSDYLAGIFGRPGLSLHGSVAVKKRGELVRDFQREDGPPFFILSLKAGGTGLNLTRASHVIHFDRWWNPAVENQATDRAFRIGQKNNVLVHKCITRGTIEEHIDQILQRKGALSESVLGSVEESITSMSDAEFLDLVRLDLKRAVEDQA